MGFGYLFVGYFFLLFFPLDGIGVLPNLAAIGCALMFFGTRRLAFFAPDCKGFRLAMYTLIPYFGLSVAALGIDIAEYSGALGEGAELYYKVPVSLVCDLLFGLLAIFLMTGIYKLAKQVELPKIAARSGIFMSLSVLYTLCALFSGTAALMGVTAGKTFTAVTNYIGFAAFLLEYAAIFVNLFHIFSCYMHICLEGDEDMPYREDIFDKIVAFTKRNKK